MMRNRPRRSIAITILLAGLLLLAGCGFQPRGQVLGPADVPGPLHLSGIRPYSALARELRRQFAQAGVAMADSAAGAASILRITRRERDSRVLSVDSRNRAVEYELVEAAEFALFGRDGSALVTPQTVRVLRILLRPSEAILGANREESLLREDMRRELAERMIQRLARQH